jgi:hypothetical protein
LCCNTVPWYKEIAFALKGGEWRKPGLVAFASVIARGGNERQPIVFESPEEVQTETMEQAAPFVDATSLPPPPSSVPPAPAPIVQGVEVLQA